MPRPIPTLVLTGIALLAGAGYSTAAAPVRPHERLYHLCGTEGGDIYHPNNPNPPQVCITLYQTGPKSVELTYSLKGNSPTKHAPFTCDPTRAVESFNDTQVASTTPISTKLYGEISHGLRRDCAR